MKKQISNLLSMLGVALKNGDNMRVAKEIDRLLELLDRPETSAHEQAGIEATGMIRKYAVKAESAYNIFGLTEMKVIAGDIYSHFPKSEKIAHVFMELVKGLLALKIEMGEHDNLEIYFDDIRDVAQAFPENRRIALECLYCYANLQENNLLSWNIRSSVANEIAEEQGKIYAKFPNSHETGVVYCRSLAAVADVALRKLRDWDLFSRYIALLRNLIDTNKFPVPENIAGFLNAVAEAYGI
jgi:hypothetical protein